MQKATAVFDADDSRLIGALEGINGKMLAYASTSSRLMPASPFDRRT